MSMAEILAMPADKIQQLVQDQENLKDDIIRALNYKAAISKNNNTIIGAGNKERENAQNLFTDNLLGLEAGSHDMGIQVEESHPDGIQHVASPIDELREYLNNGFGEMVKIGEKTQKMFEISEWSGEALFLSLTMALIGLVVRRHLFSRSINTVSSTPTTLSLSPATQHQPHGVLEPRHNSNLDLEESPLMVDQFELIICSARNQKTLMEDIFRVLTIKHLLPNNPNIYTEPDPRESPKCLEKRLSGSLTALEAGSKDMAVQVKQLLAGLYSKPLPANEASELRSELEEVTEEETRTAFQGLPTRYKRQFWRKSNNNKSSGLRLGKGAEDLGHGNQTNNYNAYLTYESAADSSYTNSIFTPSIEEYGGEYPKDDLDACKVDAYKELNEKHAEWKEVILEKSSLHDHPAVEQLLRKLNRAHIVTTRKA
ncbi:hypothetical protein G7Y89_g11787 [Cudoniella acicularis]|uniref:Uncharacterized protein n=1 Tax=Cudoniella acicularis TaxID=354080 RepID=A0A8H4RAA5_9HELO|nr:hypothetical protein G7Y89_g11787 [Cudoniella acicularis]